MSRTEFRCPTCAAPCRVKKTLTWTSNSNLRRARVCENGHNFKTFEAVLLPPLDEIALVKMTGSGATDIFRSSRLRHDINRFVSRTLTQSEVDETTEQIVATLGLRLEARSVKRPGAKDGRTHVIEDMTIGAVAADILLSKGRSPMPRASAFRVAHILYGISTKGANLHGQKGFETASDVVSWIESVYSDLAQDDGHSRVAARPVVWWWPPQFPLPTTPKYVVKKRWWRAPDTASLGDTRGGSSAKGSVGSERARKAEFDGNRLRKSIKGAFAGRHRQEEFTELVFAWVLWSLVGQSVVQSSQLSSSVTECLRMCDDVAYLRWVTVAKDLSVTQIHREAMALVAHPSPELRFDREHVLSSRPVSYPGASTAWVPNASPGPIEQEAVTLVNSPHPTQWLRGDAEDEQWREQHSDPRST